MANPPNAQNLGSLTLASCLRFDRQKWHLYLVAPTALLLIMLVACGVPRSDQRADVDPTTETESQRWTKTTTPEWATKLPAPINKFFSNAMKDGNPPPLFTAIWCNGKSTKIYINRSEWKKLKKSQATNNLMFAALLPHTDDTVIEYLDDKSGEKLATFTAKQEIWSIKVVHP